MPDQESGDTVPAKNGGKIRGPWKKGQSGNPRGVPKAAWEAKQALMLLLPDAVKRLAEMLRSDDEKMAHAAAETVLKYTVAKPAQPLTNENGQPVSIRIEMRPVGQGSTVPPSAALVEGK